MKTQTQQSEHEPYRLMQNGAFANIYQGDKTIAKEVEINRAGYIVRAVNMHGQLLEMVKEMYSAISNGHALKFTHQEYKEAIAQAEGK